MPLFLQLPPPWLREAQPCPLLHLLVSMQSTSAKSAFLGHQFGISSFNLSMLLLLYAIEHPVLTASYFFQDFPYSDPPDCPIFLNSTERLRGSHCQFVSHTHWVSNYCTFMSGRWPESSNLKQPQWLSSDYFWKLSLIQQLPQAMVSELSLLIITLTVVVYLAFLTFAVY